MYDEYSGGYPPSFRGGGARGAIRRGGLSAMAAGGQGYGGRYGDDRDRRGPGCEYMSSTGHHIHMRGLPFAAVDQDIQDVGSSEVCIALS